MKETQRERERERERKKQGKEEEFWFKLSRPKLRTSFKMKKKMSSERYEGNERDKNNLIMY